MKTLAVTITCIALSLFSLVFLAQVRKEFNGVEEHQKLAEFWQRQVAVEHLNIALLDAKFSDFQQEVGERLPVAFANLSQGVNRQKVRDLASVIPQEKVSIELALSAAKMLKNGKQSVIDQEFEKGIATLKDLLRVYPDSHHQVEAYYLIIEAYSNLGKKEEVVQWVDNMVEIFPENRLTGYALLKVGRLYEGQDRLEQALKIYRTILSAYAYDTNLIELTNKSVKLLEL